MLLRTLVPSPSPNALSAISRGMGGIKLQQNPLVLNWGGCDPLTQADLYKDRKMVVVAAHNK